MTIAMMMPNATLITESILASPTLGWQALPLLAAGGGVLLVLGNVVDLPDVGGHGEEAQAPAVVGDVVGPALLDFAVDVGRVLSPATDERVACVLHRESPGVGEDPVLAAAVGCGTLGLANGDDAVLQLVVVGQGYGDEKSEQCGDDAEHHQDGGSADTAA